MSSDMEEPDEEFYDEDDRDDDDDDGDDEEEEEEDFIPGPDDDEEEDEVEDMDEEHSPVLGTWSLDSEQKIVVQGEGFRFVSTKPVPWNLLDPRSTPQQQVKVSERIRLTLVGSCDLWETTTAVKKQTPRTLEVTWTVGSGDVPSHYLAAEKPAGGPAKANRKDSEGDDDEDDDVKKPAASPTNGKPKASNSKDDGDFPKAGQHPTLYYEVHGREVNHSGANNSNHHPGGSRHEFFGIYQPQNDNKNMRFRWRTMAAETTTTAAAARRNKDEDDDEDETEVAVDYDELIALHEDAGLSVDALRKRYRDKQQDETTNGAQRQDEVGVDDPGMKPAASNKKARGNNTKPPPAPPKDYDDDDDDDDDVEF